MENSLHFGVCSLIRLARLKTMVGKEEELKSIFFDLEKLGASETVVKNLKTIQKRLEMLEALNQTALEFSRELKLQKIECSNFLAKKKPEIKYNPLAFLDNRNERISRLSLFVNRLEKTIIIEGLPKLEPVSKTQIKSRPENEEHIPQEKSLS
jgi:ABC-type Na+ transport system ATPase subunit NatA